MASRKEPVRIGDHETIRVEMGAKSGIPPSVQKSARMWLKYPQANQWSHADSSRTPVTKRATPVIGQCKTPRCPNTHCTAVASKRPILLSSFTTMLGSSRSSMNPGREIVERLESKSGAMEPSTTASQQAALGEAPVAFTNARVLAAANTMWVGPVI